MQGLTRKIQAGIDNKILSEKLLQRAEMRRG
jgi:hypothetical protein